jgi:hypothetical protein
MDRLTKAGACVDTARVLLPGVVAGGSIDREFQAVMRMIDEAAQRTAGKDYIAGAASVLDAARAVTELQKRYGAQGAALVSSGHLDQAFTILTEAEQELNELARTQ